MGVWSDWIARWKGRSAPAEESPYVEVTPGPAASPTQPGASAEGGSWLARWRPGAKRDRQIAWLQAGYAEMLDLSRAIRQHLDRQADLQEKTARVLERLPEAIEGLHNVGRVAEQQVEVLTLLRRELENSVQHDRQLVESMNRFNETLGVMDQTARSSGQTVAELVARSRETEDLLRGVIERSEKRLSFLIGGFVVVMVLAVAAVLWVGVRQGERGNSTTPPAVTASTPVATPPAIQPAPPVPEEPEPPAAPRKKKAVRRRGFLGVRRSKVEQPEPSPAEATP